MNLETGPIEFLFNFCLKCIRNSIKFKINWFCNCNWPKNMKIQAFSSTLEDHVCFQKYVSIANYLVKHCRPFYLKTNTIFVHGESSRSPSMIPLTNSFVWCKKQDLVREGTTHRSRLNKKRNKQRHRVPILTTCRRMSWDLGTVDPQSGAGILLKVTFPCVSLLLWCKQKDSVFENKIFFDAE